MRRILALAAVLTLTACAGGRQPPPAPPPVPTTPTPPAPVSTPEPVAAPTPVAEPRPTASISGTVTYRLRIALTPEAVVQVEMRDVSRPDFEAPLIAKRVIEKPGQVPIPFTLDYDPTLIVPGRAYAVSARITDRGQLQFVTDARVAVLAGAPAPVEIVVVPVR